MLRDQEAVSSVYASESQVCYVTLVHYSEHSFGNEHSRAGDCLYEGCVSARAHRSAYVDFTQPKQGFVVDVSGF